jgi:hypothetical protein
VSLRADSNVGKAVRDRVVRAGRRIASIDEIRAGSTDRHLHTIRIVRYDIVSEIVSWSLWSDKGKKDKRKDQGSERTLMSWVARPVMVYDMRTAREELWASQEERVMKREMRRTETSGMTAEIWVEGEKGKGVRG